MAMSCIEGRAMNSTKIVRAALVIAISLAPALSACTQSSLRINPDFGNALHQDVAAQIADPDARYEGTPAPGSAGPRVGLAQKRYDANQVIPPSATTASSARSIGNADNGTPAGAGAGVGMSAGASR
jgi:hypothetical protein